MLLSFVPGLAGMFIAPIAGWLALPARLVLTYLLDMATMFSRVPHMKISVSVSIVATLTMYGMILFVMLVLWRKNIRSDKITDVKAEVILQN